MRAWLVVLIAACSTAPRTGARRQALTGDWEMTVLLPGSTTGCAGADGVNLADHDADGDVDIATGCEQSSNVWVVTQPGDPWGSAWGATNAGANPSVEDAIWADLDDDTAIDAVLSAGEGKKLKSHPEPFTSSTVLWTAPYRILQLARADVDCDGDTDTIIGGRSIAPNVVAKIAWRKTPEGTITDIGVVGHTMSLIPFQADSDCAPEILVSDRTWYPDPAQPSGRNYSLRGIRWLDVENGTWINHMIAPVPGDVGFAALGDLDLDGDLDVVGGTSTLVKVYENNGDFLSWSTEDLPSVEDTGTFHDALICDVNEDTAPDIVLSFANGGPTDHGVVMLDGANAWAATSVSGPGASKYDNAECATVGGVLAIVQSEQHADTDGDGDVGPGLGVVAWRLP